MISFVFLRDRQKIKSRNGGRKKFRPHRVLFNLQDKKCFYCNVEIFEEHNDIKKRYTVDHLFPKSRGFSRHGNIVISCLKCNKEKKAEMPTIEQVIQASKLYTKLNEVDLKNKARLDIRFVCKMRYGKPVIRIS